MIDTNRKILRSAASVNSHENIALARLRGLRLVVGLEALISRLLGQKVGHYRFGSILCGWRGLDLWWGLFG
jgi:hypothetical protein